MKPILSILVANIPARWKSAQELITSLHQQAEATQNTELLIVSDNCWRTIGRKRQDMLNMAQGTFVVHVDDDDTVSPDFVDKILEAIYKNPTADCFVYGVWVTGYDVLGMQDSKGSLCKYSVEYEHKNEADGAFFRKPNCRMVVRKTVAQQVPFKDVSSGEDDEWGKELAKRINKEKQVDIPHTLYFYHFNIEESESSWVQTKRAKTTAWKQSQL